MITNTNIIQPDIIVNKNKYLITNLLPAQRRLGCKASLNRGIEDFGQTAGILEFNKTTIDHI